MVIALHGANEDGACQDQSPPHMKLRLLGLAGFLSVFCLLNLARADPEFLKDFPPLVLVGQSKGAEEAFKNSATTRELYAKYYGFARMMKTGDVERQKKFIKSQLENDLPYWKAEASRKFFAPPKPKTKEKKVLDAYEARVEKAQAIHDRKIAVAETYRSWLEVEIPAWVKKFE